MKKESSGLTYLMLHVLLMLFSLSTVCSKLAGQQPFFSFKFCLFYGLVVLLLGIYALAWQQVIKRMPLTTAYANKAVTVVWGLIWGLLIFNEKLTLGKVAGATVIMAGIILFARSDPQEASSHE